mgnify:CR=1 FL=1
MACKNPKADKVARPSMPTARMPRTKATVAHKTDKHVAALSTTGAIHDTVGANHLKPCGGVEKYHRRDNRTRTTTATTATTRGLKADGTFTYSAASASTNATREDTPSQKMRSATIKDVFNTIFSERTDTVEQSPGGTQREFFKSMRLTFNYSPSLEGVLWADTSENPDEEGDEASEVCETLLQDTQNSVSLAMSGPTTAGADKTLRKLMFSCGGPSCPSKGEAMFTLNHLMPTEVEGMTKDYCYECFKDFMEADMSKKAFVLGVMRLRMSEKLAVTLQDAMVHAPLENLIFNSFKKLQKEAQGEGKRFLTLQSFRVWAYIRATGKYPPQGDQPGKPASLTDQVWASKPFQDF